jgi:hypothetical protein
LLFGLIAVTRATECLRDSDGFTTRVITELRVDTRAQPVDIGHEAPHPLLAPSARQDAGDLPPPAWMRSINAVIVSSTAAP